MSSPNERTVLVALTFKAETDGDLPSHETIVAALSRPVIGEVLAQACAGAGHYPEISMSIASERQAIEANAAPDLLAALKRVRDGVKEDSPDMWDEVDNAIAKAEGIP